MLLAVRRGLMAKPFGAYASANFNLWACMHLCSDWLSRVFEFHRCQHSQVVFLIMAIVPLEVHCCFNERMRVVVFKLARARLPRIWQTESENENSSQ